MSIAEGVFKQTRIKRQSAKGEPADGASGGQVVRRTSSIFEKQVETYNTNDEMNTPQQTVSVSHGVQLINGSLNGILSPGTYADILSSIVKRDFTAVSGLSALTLDVEDRADEDAPYLIIRSAGSWLTDGVKVGHVIRLGGVNLDAANVGVNLFVVSVTALELQVYVVNEDHLLVPEAAAAASTVSFPGRVTYAPPSGHTRIYYTVEEWNPDIPSSEMNQDVRFGQAQIQLPGSGNSTISFTANGRKQTASDTEYFTAPAAETSTGACAASCGALIVHGEKQATITDMQITVNNGLAPADGVVGTNIRPDIFGGKIQVSGQFTAYFDNRDIPNLFDAATDITILNVIAASKDLAADFIAFSMPKVKLTSNTPDDVETGQKRTFQFTAQYMRAGGAGTAHNQTTLQIHDSAAAAPLE